MLSVICKLTVNLVRKNKQVVFFDNARNLLKVLTLHDSAGGIVRIGENKQL